MDIQQLFGLSRLSTTGRGNRRIQWQVHVQSVCFAGWQRRDVQRPYSPHLPQFLSTTITLAVFRHPFGAIITLNHVGSWTLWATPQFNAQTFLPSGNSSFIIRRSSPRLHLISLFMVVYDSPLLLNVGCASFYTPVVGHYSS